MRSANIVWFSYSHTGPRRSLAKPLGKMLGFPCSAFLALYLMALIFLQGAATSIDSPATQAAAVPSSNISYAGTTAPRITFTPRRSFTQDGRQDVGRRLNSCPNCNSYKDDNFEDSPVYKLRIEIIKANILAKLQIDKAPVLKHKKRDSRIAALLANLNLIQQKNAKDQSKDSNEEHFGTTTKIIVFSERVKVANSRSKRRMSRKAVFEFKLSRNTFSGSVSSARMWLNKRKSSNVDLKGKTFEVRVRITGIGDKTGTVKAKVKTRKSGWVVLDIKDTIQEWFGPDRTIQQSSKETGVFLEIQVSCQNCETDLSHLISTRGKQRPFLVISTKSEISTSRRRRSSDCLLARPDHCCRQMLYVNFSKIGWNWVIYPEGFHANFCEGPCESRISPLNGYAFLLKEMQGRKLTNFSLCCSPSKLSGLSMLYFAEDESIMKQNLPDMHVEACGCT